MARREPARARSGLAVAASAGLHLLALGLLPAAVAPSQPVTGPRAVAICVYRGRPLAVRGPDRPVHSATSDPRRITIHRRRLVSLPERWPQLPPPAARPRASTRSLVAPQPAETEPLVTALVAAGSEVVTVPVDGGLVRLALPDPPAALPSSLTGPLVIAAAVPELSAEERRRSGLAWRRVPADQWLTAPEDLREWWGELGAPDRWLAETETGPLLWLPLPVRAGWEARTAPALACWANLLADDRFLLPADRTQNGAVAQGDVR